MFMLQINSEDNVCVSVDRMSVCPQLYMCVTVVYMGCGWLCTVHSCKLASLRDGRVARLCCK